MKNILKVRLVKSKDYKAVLDIYKPFVNATSITPEFNAPSLLDFSNRLKNITAQYPFLVCEMNQIIIGYAYATKFRQTDGHQWSVELTIYLSPDYHHKGVASALYTTLFSILKFQNYINAFAVIILPNKKSEAFHQRLGFQEVGIFKNGIYKSGLWHDAKWLQLNLSEHVKKPLPPKPITELKDTPELDAIIQNANNNINCFE
jgi:phosphinothricin acetyltransferase